MKSGTREANSSRRNRRQFSIWVLGVAITLGCIGNEGGKIASQSSPSTEAGAAESLASRSATAAPPGNIIPNTEGPREQQSRLGSALAPSLAAAPELEADAFHDFDRWLTEYLAAGPSEKAALDQTGQALAARRREALAREIERDPEASLRHAVPVQSRPMLPPSIVEQLEERVSGAAELVVLATIGLPDGGEPNPAITRQVNVNGQSYRAFVYGRRLQQTSQTNLPIHGIAVGQAMAVHEDPARRLEPGETPDPRLRVANLDGRCPISSAPANPLVTVEVGGQIYRLCCGEHAQALNQSVRAAEDARARAPNTIRTKAGERSWTKGVRTLLFMRVNFPDHPTPSIDVVTAGILMDQVNRFIRENSYGQTSIRTTITPVLPMANSIGWYETNFMTMLDEARSVAASTGYDTANYDLDCVFCGPNIPVNQAFVGRKGAWVTSADPGVVGHERGHNFGLSHANAWATSDGTTIGNGENREYGNVFDTMGGGSVLMAPFGAYERHLLDWLPDGAVTEFTSNGVYRLHPFNLPTLADGQSYALNIPKDDQRDYWLEMHQTNDFAELNDGLLLQWSPWAQSNGGAQLLNCHPAVPYARSLRAGQAFYDLEIGLKIMPLQFTTESPEAADVLMEQVYFLPVEVPFTPSTIGWTKTALKSAVLPAPPREGTQQCAVTIPETGSYYIWVQTRNRSLPQPGSFISIENEDGQIGTVLSDASLVSNRWHSARATSANSATAGAQRFSFPQGVQKISVHSTDPRPDLVRLLITNDSSTNLPPVLPELVDPSMATDSSLVIPFFVSAIGQFTAGLKVHASSDNSSVIPAANLILDGHESDWTLTIRSTPALTGTAQVTLTVTDAAGTFDHRSFKVTITHPRQRMLASTVGQNADPYQSAHR